MPVLRTPANVSDAVAFPVALVFLRFAFVSVKVSVGLVLSMIKFAVSAVLFNPALS